MRERAEDLQRDGVTVVAVGRRAPWQAARLREKGMPFELLCDPEGRLFEALGLRPRAGVLLRPRGWARWVAANLRGHRQGMVTGNVVQPPGDAVLDAEGRLRFLHRGRALGDHAPVARLVEEAVRLAHAGPSSVQ